jgi:peptidoglycan/LPS O-acetylase OafA/YrhL
MIDNYRPELDGVRAFCIIFTVLNHVPGRPWFIDGTVGVDAFFPLSGWLITWLLLEERKNLATINLGAFYIRRIFRIVPLYYLTISIYAIAALSLYVVAGAPAKLEELRRAALYLVTFNSEYRADDAGVVFGHAWTLGIEEKFYIVWPLLLLLAGRFTAAAAVGAIVAIGVLFAAFGVNDYLLRGYFGLSLGAALALWINGSSTPMSLFKTIPLGWPCLGAASIMYALLIAAPSVVWHFGFSVSSALLIVSVWFCREQGLARLLRLPPIAWLGTLTYAIYLLQTLGINVAQGVVKKLHLPDSFLSIFVIGYAVSIAAAWLAHVLVERPAIDMGRKLARQLKLRPVLRPD